MQLTKQESIESESEKVKAKSDEKQESKNEYYI